MFNNEFYPTPIVLINKMLSDIDFRTIRTVLEPSAGDGRIVEQVLNKFKYAHYNNSEEKFDVDTIEIDSNLQHILTGKGYRVIHDDFLTLNTFKRYDVIVMNPPFSNGDLHLLKAIEMQQQGGKIVCLLNAETLKNPYSNARKDLLRKLDEYNAEVEYIQNAFVDAENKTNVEIALIRIDIPKTTKDSIILDNLKKEEQYQQKHYNSNNNLIDGDFIQGIIQQYNFEIKAGVNLINEYENLKPLMLTKFKEKCSSSILQLVVDGNSKNNNSNDTLINTYIKKVRSKYWEALFTSEQFNQLLTSKLQTQYYNKIDELCDYDFSYYNIKQIQLDINRTMIQSVEKTILDLFEEFSNKHHYYDETSKNIHYYNGWKTNSAFKINKKVIIPLSGFRDMQYSRGSYNPTYYTVVRKLMDIEKCLNYLDGGLTEEIDIQQQLKVAEQNQESKDIQLKYFSISFYKKGTTHILFTNEELLSKFNIFGSHRKGWLPPTYGRVKYEDMTAEEQSVVNEFQGKEEYNKVMCNKDYYIYNPDSVLMLSEKTA